MGQEMINSKEKFLEIESKYSKSFSKAIFSLAKKDQKIPFRVYLEHKSKLKDPAKVASDVLMIVASRIKSGVEYCCLAQYLYMKLSDSWTDAGYDRVQSAMMHLFLDIPVDAEINFADYQNIETVIRDRVVAYDLQDKTKDQLAEIIKSPTIRIFDRSFEFSQTAEVNAVLEVLESGRRIMMGKSGEYVTMIFGLAKTVQYNKYFVHFFNKEEMRTPGQVNYIVACIDQDQIAIRREVCEYIFHQKWLPVLDDNDLFYQEHLSSSPETAIAEYIKQKTCELFQVSNREEFLAIKEKFVDSMIENFLYHEIAHDALEESNLTKEELAITGAISLQEENMLTVMNELLTEWMPAHGNVFGPMKNILKIAFEQGNSLKAKQLLFIYLSDGWFLDTDTEFMYPYTYVMFCICLKYLQEEEIDFATLYNDSNDIFNFLADWYRSSMSEVISEMKKAEYLIDGKKCSLKDIQKSLSISLGLFDVFAGRNLDDDESFSRLWINTLIQIKSFKPELLNKIREFLHSQEKTLYSELILKFGGKSSADKYGSDIRSYVIDKFMEITNVDRGV